MPSPISEILLVANGEGMPAGEIGRGIFFLILLIFLNGFFVAAEFALVKLRDGQLDDPIDAGRRSARLARHILQNLDPYLSACQLGITIASIVLGAVSAPFLAQLLGQILPGNLSPDALHITAWIVAIGVITFLHVVIGERMPKVFAIHKSLGTTLFCSRPLHWFYLILRGPVWILNACSNGLLRVFFKIDDTEKNGSHDPNAISSAELRVLVKETGEAKEVTETEQEILMNALELNELTVRDIVVPRNRVVALDVNHTFEENLKIALDTTHTRFPLIDGHLDKTTGLIHIKDLIREMQKDAPNLQSVRRDITVVLELLPLDDMLKRFQKTRASMALVVDEYGGSLGLAMLDDVLDQVVGDIADEFDEGDDPRFNKINDDEFMIRGDYPLHELDDEIEELDLESPDVSTIGGYITELLGHLPKIDEILRIENFEIHVIEADAKSVKQLKFVRLEPSKGHDEEE